MQEMVIDSIRFSVQNYGQRVVILRQKDSTPGIYLPIWIGASEAESIALTISLLVDYVTLFTIFEVNGFRISKTKFPFDFIC